MARETRRRLVRGLRHGQVTIPKEFRDALGFDEGDLWEMTLREGKIEVRPATAKPKVGSPWLKELYELYAPVREALRGRHTEEEINEWIDEAVREARKERRERST